ncbi:hypothetical protein QBC32DRAFT_337572 [Pseudoneurospora amorphoporcata]|uniref:C2H2-type domain-containing protein n=1 Tax=Pseudoneurospora amorphoporcata TaxID=241081 RepID=A0AAN6NXX5_9PEZI|nr:hypothetical protein QBC32DRAFT_337572 [Pseudoneurospora amorphoporcata]
MTNPWFFSNDSYNYQHMQYPYNRMEDTLIDPMLQSLTPPAVYPTTMDQHQPMQRQFKEDQQTMFFNPDMPQQATFMPSMFHQVRYNSPFSTFEASEASGSAQSPPADTNTELSAYCEIRSPLQEPLPFEDIGFSQNHSVQFAGLGLGTFVNPMDVNSTGQLDGYDSDTSTPELFTLPQRVNSWESYTTGGASAGCDMEQMQQMQQHTSPIVDCTKPVVNHYPVPTSQEKVEEQSPTTPPLNLKRTRSADADDDEYLPTTKRTASLPSTATKPRTTPARRGRPPTSSHSPLTTNTHRPHGPQHQSQPSTAKSKALSLTPNSSRGTLLCPHPPCQQSHSSHGFKDQPSLDAHIKKQHSRPFICVFSFAGCDSTFGSKNEWKRHVASQHLVLEYWLCREGECASVDNNLPGSTSWTTTTTPTTKGASGWSRAGRRSSAQVMVTGQDDDDDDEDDMPRLPNGAIFNRKDLYTQHVRRMHLPSHLAHLGKESTTNNNNNKKPSSSSTLNHANDTTATATATAQELTTYIESLRSRAAVKRCSLPTYMRCPVPSCTHGPFKGTEAWDQRMEHVAKHLEKYAAAAAASSASLSANITERNGDQDKVEFGSETDTTLTEWASSREVGIIVKRVKTGTGTGTRGVEEEGDEWVTRDPIRRRGHGGGNGNGNRNSHHGHGRGRGCGVGRGGRTRPNQVKNRSAKEAAVKREQQEDDQMVQVKQEIVVHTQQQTFDFDGEGEDFGDEYLGMGNF